MNLRKMILDEKQNTLATIDDYELKFTIERCDYDRSVSYVLEATCDRVASDRYKVLKVDKIINNFMDQEPSQVHHALLFQLKMYIQRHKIYLN